MALTVGKRFEWVRQSEIRNMSIECDKVGGINLSQGVCDLDVPEEVVKGAQKAIEDGYNIYTRYDGLDELRSAIAAKHALFTGFQINPHTEIVVSAGSTGALYCACLALLDPGDEVILFEPYYGYHISTLRATQAVPVYILMEPPDWRFSDEALEKAVTSKTRAIVLCTPANPSGKVFSDQELERIATFSKKHDLFVFTDEIYEHFVYDGACHRSIARIAGMKERTITVTGLSKTFSITGWRIGYCICDAKWTQSIGYFNDLVYVCAPSPLQMGVAAGLMSLGREYYRKISDEYKKKRDKICASLSDSGLEPFVPQGAYYVLADISGLPGKKSKEKALYLLHKTGVACVPGEAFYHDDAGENIGRFCFAKKNEVLDEACLRLKKISIK